MLRDDWKSNINNINESELTAVSAKDEYQKLKKEIDKNKRAIDEYKEREKASARALILYERKIRYLKQKTIDEVLSLCHSLEERLSSENDFSKQELENAIDKLYDVCNMVEQNAGITNEDRAFISNKPVPEKPLGNDINSRFARLKQEFNQKVGESVLRKPGRPKKQDQSIVSDIGLGKKIKEDRETDETAKAKLNEIFYETPKNTSVMSNIPLTEDSLFDFEEALNPNLSLEDIMADLMSEKSDEPVKTYSKIPVNERQSLVSGNGISKEKSRVEMLEAGIFETHMPKQIKNNIKQPEIIKESETEEKSNKFISLGSFLIEDDE